MAHDPAPASASLYRLRRQTALRGTVSPSSRRHGRGGNGPLSGLQGRGGTNIPTILPAAPSAWGRPCPVRPVRRGGGGGGPPEGAVRRRSRAKALTHPPAKAPPSPGGRCSAPENTLEGEGSMVLRRTVCGEAVERSAGRRRTADSCPFHTQQKEQQTALLGRPTPFRLSF